MSALKKKCWYKLLPVILGVFLLTGLFSLLAPDTAYAVGGDITISGEGLNNPDGITVTQSQLRGTEALPDELQTVAGAVYLPQQDEIYSTINTWPTKSWYRGQGVKLMDLLKLAGGLNEDATQIRFTSRDDFKATFTVQEIIDAFRYRFPNFMDTGYFGHIPGNPSGAEPVETIIAHQSFSVQDYDDIYEDWFSVSDANHLLYGQRAVTQQTNSRFAKYLSTIEVLTDPTTQWEEPTVTVDPGEVEVGTPVELHSPYDDEDKVHYTLDGTVPTIESPMYNRIAKRWWSQRQDDLATINHPIEITENTTIKAFVTGPGRLDSDVVTFEYTVQIPLTIKQDNPVKAIMNQEYTHTFTAVGGVEPYSFSITNGSLPEGLTLSGAVLKGTPTKTGTYTFTIIVTDSADKEASQEFTLVVKEAPPTLSADTTDNTVGQPIEISFTDDQTWRDAIADVKVNDASVAGRYTVAAGKITLDPEVFTTAGSYTIAVVAAGYADAVVIQQVNSSGSGQQPDPDKDIVLTITGDGVTNLQEYTQSQLEGMPQQQCVYSSINTWPTKSWYVGKGVSLKHLLDEAGIKGSARQIKFVARDGYYMTLTVQELLQDKRYCFPNFKSGSGDADGHIPGSSSGAREVEPILALVSASGTDNPAYMNDTNTPLLMLGQRAVTEQTGPLFTKYVNRIEVITNPPGRWAAPTAEPRGGTVSAGTKVELHSPNDDTDKVYYTTDGSTPTLDSPMFNWIASRWWSSRGEEARAQINCPIELTQDTTIKAVTIGPGKLNSDVVEFIYKIEGPATGTSGKIKPDEGGQVSLEDEVVIDLPSGALEDTDEVEVKIERVSEPPDAPDGFQIMGSVYEFQVGDKTSYSFNKPVTIKLTFDPDKVGPGEIPAVYYFDESEEKWVNLGGEISGNTITVQVDHFTKFAVMIETKSEDEDEPLNLIDIAGHWAEENITHLVALGAVSGYPDNTFKPENKITRAEFAAILVKAFKLESQKGKVFADTASHWARDSISTAACHDIVSGYDATTFGPDDNITREQMAVMVMNALQLPAVTADGSLIDSNSISGWAKEAVATAVKNGIINGYPDNTFRPRAKATRAEAVTVVVNALNI